jgi:hypothetical protein
VAAQRQTVIALTVLAILTVAIGVLASIKTDPPNPDAVKAELQAKMVQLDEMTEPIAQEKFAKELLANELYPQYARALYGKLERALPRIREAATLERAAMKEVPNFLAKCKDLRRVPPEELEALHGEALSFVRTYGTTRYREQLHAVVQELKLRCELIVRATARDVMALSAEVQMLLKEGKDCDAEDRIRDFVKKFTNAAEFSTQIREMQQQVVRYRAARDFRRR